MVSNNSLVNKIQKLNKYREYIFRSHAKYILKEYLEDWINKIITLSLVKTSIYTAIIVEDRVDEITKFCIYNTLLMTRLRLNIILFTTHDSFKQMQDLFANLNQWVTVIELNDQDNKLKKINTKNYNKILKSSAFWEILPKGYIFVFQRDSLLIEPVDFSEFHYDYIGAPFSPDKYISSSFPEFLDISGIKKVEKWVTQVCNKVVHRTEGVFIGNGGFSLRNRDVMLQICKNEFSPNDENEDMFFSRLINSYSQNIVPFDIAKRFSCETTYFKSIGAHASYLYLTHEQQAEIYERHIKHIFALIDLPNDSTFTQ